MFEKSFKDKISNIISKNTGLYITKYKFEDDIATYPVIICLIQWHT